MLGGGGDGTRTHEPPTASEILGVRGSSFQVATGALLGLLVQGGSERSGEICPRCLHRCLHFRTTKRSIRFLDGLESPNANGFQRAGNRATRGGEGVDTARPQITNQIWRFLVSSYSQSVLVFAMSETSVATKVRRRVLASGERFWRPDDFEGSSEAVAKALSRLVASGDIRRVRRGLYWRGATSRLGMAPPPVDRLADELVGMPGSGPAGWSAALALGLSTRFLVTSPSPCQAVCRSSGTSSFGESCGEHEASRRATPAIGSGCS